MSNVISDGKDAVMTVLIRKEANAQRMNLHSVVAQDIS